jgi:hypothetical protein
MNSRSKKLLQDIGGAKKRIVELFVDQCKHGKQSENLGEGILACGQFIGDSAKTVKQRGVHGTASALKILAKSQNNSAAEIIPGLVKYLEDRKNVERQQSDAPSTTENKCDKDHENVIKVSEILIALSAVTQANANKEHIITDLSAKLKTGMINDKGWDYFIDDKNEIEPLPTAFAMLAMFGTGYYLEANKAADYLKKLLDNRYSTKAVHNRISIDVMTIDIFCLYALTFMQKDSVSLKHIFDRIWDNTHSLLDDDLEQNVEYLYKGQQSCYIRVPWQLYMLSLVEIYGFKWKFSSTSIQNILRGILSRVLNGGFRYPNSGRMVSARTNAILFEVLSTIEDALQHKSLSWSGGTWDSVKTVWYSKLCSWPVRISLILMGAIIVCVWLANCNSLTDLAPEMVSIGWTALFSLTFVKK